MSLKHSHEPCMCVTCSVQVKCLAETAAQAQAVVTGPSNLHLSKSFTLGKSAGMRLHAGFSTSVMFTYDMALCVNLLSLTSDLPVFYCENRFLPSYYVID